MQSWSLVKGANLGLKVPKGSQKVDEKDETE